MSNFLLTILLARIFTIEEFGVFTTVWLAILFINSLHQAAIIHPFMTLSKDHNKKETYRIQLQTLQFLFLLLSVPVFIIILFIIDLFVPLQNNILIPATLTMLAYHMQDYMRKLYFIDNQNLQALITSTASYVIRFIIILFLINYTNIEFSIVNVFWAVFASFFIGITFALKKVQPFRYDRDCLNATLKLHWQTAKWLLPSGLMQWSSINLYIVAAATLLSPIVVAAIRMGQNLTQAFNVLLMAGENYFPITASKTYQKHGIIGLKKYLIKIVLIFTVLMSPFSLMVYTYNENIVMFIYGEKYAQYSYILNYFLVVAFLMVLMSILRVYLRVISETKPWFIGYVFSSVIALTLVYPLESRLGLNGALIGMIISQLVLLTSVVVYAKNGGHLHEK